MFSIRMLPLTMPVGNSCTKLAANRVLRQWIAVSAASVVLIASACRANSQSNNDCAQDSQTYGFRMSVDEVELTFHAEDSHGLPVNDLKPEELKLLDNGKPPLRVLAFYSMQDFPIRAGILMDTSESMDEHLHRSHALATECAQHMLRQQTDRAFVMDFGYMSKVVMPWSNDPAALSAAIRGVTAGRENPLGGTALFDTLLAACFHQFGKLEPASSGNFILLFSDGEDNASHTSLQEAVDACQHANTAIYAFRAEPKPGLSTGPRTLAELARQTGGRVFPDADSDSEIDHDLRTIEADLRNQYRMVYKPAGLKSDGSFHTIVLLGPDRADRINVRSGYYAPAR